MLHGARPYGSSPDGRTAVTGFIGRRRPLFRRWWCEASRPLTHLRKPIPPRRGRVGAGHGRWWHRGRRRKFRDPLNSSPERPRSGCSCRWRHGLLHCAPTIRLRRSAGSRQKSSARVACRRNHQPILHVKPGVVLRHTAARQHNAAAECRTHARARSWHRYVFVSFFASGPETQAGDFLPEPVQMSGSRLFTPTGQAENAIPRVRLTCHRLTARIDEALTLSPRGFIRETTRRTHALDRVTCFGAPAIRFQRLLRRHRHNSRPALFPRPRSHTAPRLVTGICHCG